MVSVCIATFNGERFILQQIESILNQLDVNDELIISDDGSTDKTINLVESLGDKRIKIIQDNNFKSPIYNFENALKYATGEYIFMSDQDDVWLDSKVKIMVEQMEFGYDLVISDCELVDQNLIKWNPSYFHFNKSGPGIIKNIIKNSYMGCCMAMSRRLLDTCLPFPPNLPMHDSYIGLVGELKFKVKFINVPLLLHRKHLNNSSSTSTGKSNYSLIQKTMFRICLIFALIKKYNE
jgi:glycosyltransferase involved in cell wall biosynthesis